MQALVKQAPGPGNVRLMDVPEPEPGAGQVRIAVQAAGICGSDLHILHGDIKLIVRPPVVMGHELSGIIDRVGEGVSDWAVGDRVTAETAVHTCGECMSCRTGFYNRCAAKEILGYVYPGAFAPYTVVAAERLHRLPDSLDFVSAAMSEPLACCVRALYELATITAGDTVVVAGPGAIGLLCAQLARAAGARVHVVGTSADARRLAIADSLGATRTLVVGEVDVRGEVLAATRGEGCDVFVEASGAPAAARMGLDITRRGGQYVQVGLAGGPFEIDLSLLAYKELHMVGSLGQRWTAWVRALSLVADGKLHLRPLATHVLPLDQWEEGFRAFESRESIKVILTPR